MNLLPFKNKIYFFINHLFCDSAIPSCSRNEPTPDGVGVALPEMRGFLRFCEQKTRVRLEKPRVFQRALCCFTLLMVMAPHGLTHASSGMSTHSPLQLNHNGNAFPEKDLKVGVLTIWPYGSESRGEFSGLAYDIWSVIANENNFHSTYLSLGEDIDEAVDKVARGDIDIAIGPIAILSQRILATDFTQPFYLDELILVGKKISLSTWQRFNAFFGNKSLLFVLALIVIYYIYLHVFWHFEHNKQADLRDLPYKKGLHKLIWQSVLAQKGKHPYFPQTLIVRYFSLLWSLLVVSFFISVLAGLSASFITRFDKDKMLFTTMKAVGKSPIAVFGYAGTISDAKEAGLNVTASSTSIDVLMDMLDSGKVSGVFMPIKLALNYIEDNKNDDLYISPIKFNKLHLGFATANTIQSLLPRINASLLRMTETGEKMKICEYYKSDLLDTGCN